MEIKGLKLLPDLLLDTYCEEQNSFFISMVEKKRAAGTDFFAVPL